MRSMGFSRQEYWSGLPYPAPADLPDPGIEPWSPTLQTDSLPSEPPGKPGANPAQKQACPQGWEDAMEMLCGPGLGGCDGDALWSRAGRS